MCCIDGSLRNYSGSSTTTLWPNLIKKHLKKYIQTICILYKYDYLEYKCWAVSTFMECSKMSNKNNKINQKQRLIVTLCNRCGNDSFFMLRCIGWECCRAGWRWVGRTDRLRQTLPNTGRHFLFSLHSSHNGVKCCSSPRVRLVCQPDPVREGWVHIFSLQYVWSSSDVRVVRSETETSRGIGYR